MVWEIVLWIWVGIIIGSLVGSVLTYMVQKGKVLDLQDEVYDSRVVREALKEEIFRLENQSKPKPRKRRGKAQKK
tara:strand:+ start:640 stop:864 length:225 start_codon:yes stop_codon:yes gene_type:complete